MSVGERVRTWVRRARRLERREVREFRAWVETTRNLVHLTLVVAVPVLIGIVTALSNAVDVLPFLLFPPLAAGTYTLFADPEGRYAEPTKFVGGLTTGAVCGYLALTVGSYVYAIGPSSVHAGSAALAVFLTGVATWALDLEVPSAFSTALLTLVAGPSSALFGSQTSNTEAAFLYVVGVLVSSSIVAGVFVVYRRQFYEQRAEYLYESTKGDDHVLVPMRGAHADATAMLAAHLAAAHDAGKVVLLDLVSDDAVEAAERGEDVEVVRDGGTRTGSTSTDGTSTDGTSAGDAPTENSQAAERAAAAYATDLETRAQAVRTKVGVPCEVVVAGEGATPSNTVLDVAHRTNCDLIAVPYETRHGALSPFLRELFVGDTDVLVHRSADDRTEWSRVLVPVRSPSDAAHAMLDFAARLVGRTGTVAVCHCIGAERDRRRAESMLADLSETVRAAVETRISQRSIESFLDATAEEYDLVIIGASRDRSAASRFVSPPTFERIRDLDTDVAILDRNFRV